MSLSAVVIGLGQIGQGYDYESKGPSFLTHASGYHFHNSYDLLGAYDINIDCRKAFEKKFSKPTFGSVEQLMITTKPDIVSIAVPTEFHFNIFNQIINFSPKAIICEKPISSSLNQAKQMVQSANSNNCSLIVNYVRRFEPGVNEIKNKITDNYFGDFYKGIVWYSKGLINNGSHFIDLLIYLFGDVSEINIISKGRSLNNGDFEPDLSIKFGKTFVIFVACKEENYEINEIELVGEKGSIRYSNGGESIKYRLTKKSSTFKDYVILNNKEKVIKSDINKYQYYVLDNIVNHFEKNIPLKSDGNTATAVIEVINKIKLIL